MQSVTLSDIPPSSSSPSPHEILSSVFGYDAFRGEQEAIIDDVIAGRSCGVLMPTGSGKSLCYQIPSICMEGVGANPYYVDAEEHDTYTAGVSHLPFLLSTGLVATTTSSPSWLEMGRIAATGYRDISRLASGDPVMHRDICVTNRESVVYWIDEFIKNLYSIRNMIQAEDDDGLEKLFVHCWEARARWMAGSENLPTASPDIPSHGEGMMSMFVGGNMARRMRDISNRNQTDKTRYNKR